MEKDILYGLKGEDIPLVGRVIAIADSYDAMSSDRIYRKRLSEDKIISELNKGKGTQFDPKLVDYMIDMIKDGFVKSVQERIDGNIYKKEENA